MRSFLLTAAMAATLVTTSLSLGYAAPAGREGSPGMQSHMEKGLGERNESGKWDAASNILSFPQAFATEYLMRRPATYSTQDNPRLSLIVSEVDRADQRIRAGRQHHTLTAAEARDAREEGQAIRTTAMNIVAAHDGQIPDASYEMLRGRVAALDQTIQLDTTHA